MDMWPQPTDQGSPGTRRQAPVRLARSVAAPHPHRLAVAEPPARRPGPGPDRPHRPHRRGGPPDRIRPRLRRLARVLGRSPDPGPCSSTAWWSSATAWSPWSWSSWWRPPSSASVFRVPRRRDLIWLSGGLVAGVLAQAVLGGIVVYTKLNPYVVMVHFFATMLLLVDAVVLVHRSTRDYAPGSAHLLVPRPLIRLFYGAPGAPRAGDRRRHGHHRARDPTPATPRASRWPSGSPLRCATWPSSIRVWPCC